jgi:colanic acid biosynthesis protein WcaH
MFIPQEEYDKILSMMPILCVDLMILFNGKCLLLKRKNEPAKGQYWFPGGRICKMETIKEAVLRKAKEEVNLDCQFQEIIAIEESMFKQNKNMMTDTHTVNICCKLVTDSISEISLDKQHDSHIWVTIDDAEKLDFHPCVIGPLKKVFDQRP